MKALLPAGLLAAIAFFVVAYNPIKEQAPVTSFLK
jgi:hypothetical protein